jgi:3-oxoacyl-(acyl-carrier-protein) synthase
MSKQRVVVTGMGAISSLGGVDEFWKGLLAGRSGIRHISRFDASSMKTQVAGEVDFDPCAGYLAHPPGYKSAALVARRNFCLKSPKNWRMK